MHSNPEHGTRRKHSSPVIRLIRALAGLCAVTGVVIVSVAVAVVDRPPEDVAAIAIMGGMLSLTPYVLVCAIEEVLRERRP